MMLWPFPLQKLPCCFHTVDAHTTCTIIYIFMISSLLFKPPAILFVYPYILSYIHQVVAVWSDTKIQI